MRAQLRYGRKPGQTVHFLQVLDRKLDASRLSGKLANKWLSTLYLEGYRLGQTKNRPNKQRSTFQLLILKTKKS